MKHILYNLFRCPSLPRHAQRESVNLGLVAPVELRESFFIALAERFSRTSSLSCASMCVSPDVTPALSNYSRVQGESSRAGGRSMKRPEWPRVQL